MPAKTMPANGRGLNNYGLRIKNYGFCHSALVAGSIRRDPAMHCFYAGGQKFIKTLFPNHLHPFGLG